MKTLSTATILLATSMLSSGCVFTVKNTAGIRAAFHDMELAYPLAAEIRQSKSLSAGKVAEVKDSYNEAKAEVNSFLQDVKIKASTYTVDIGEDVYKNDKASKAMADFMAKADAARGVRLKSVEAVVVLVTPIIEEIVKLNDQKQKEAYDRFQKVIDDNKMVEWEKTPGGKP